MCSYINYYKVTVYDRYPFSFYEVLIPSPYNTVGILKIFINF